MRFIFCKKITLSIVALSACLTAPVSYADVVISGTRIIYPGSSKEVSVKLDNRGTKPLLVQSWLDDGRESVNPQEMKIPFLVTPPVSRIDAKKGQTVKIAFLGANLPKNKESLFWFNVLEIPPKAKNSKDANLLQLAFRTRIKMFYRPDGLQGSPEEAARMLKWSLKKNKDGIYAEAKNDSPYYVSFNDATLISKGKKYNIDTHTIAPETSESLKIKEMRDAPVNGNIKYNAINDYGGNIEVESEVKF